ncbi:MAG: hypothetical protein K2I46_05710, partial [Clostridia bacterium]|nr:hypothetical protein [Clostridia bacterium]
MEDNTLSETANNIITNAGSLSSFANGTKYVFTDKSKVDGYRAGTESYDITIETVDTSQTIGSQKNPYVIASTDEWEIFVKQMEIDSTHGNGQYFVLGCDLDFSNVTTFRMVCRFNGTFYGMGNSMKNISCDTWQYYNPTTQAYANLSRGMTSDGFGLFSKIENATICDLILIDLHYSNVPVISTIYSGCGPYVGGIVGAGTANSYILNCHVTGKIEVTSTYHTMSAGIIGVIPTTGTVVMVYRCSVSVKFIMDSPTPCDAYVAGILGRSYNSANLKVYDSVASVDVDFVRIRYYSVNIAVGSITGGPTVIENFVGEVNANRSSTDNILGGLIACVHTATTIDLKNIYGSGQVYNTSTSTPVSIYSIVGGSSTMLANTKASNVNTVAVSSTYAKLVTSYRGVNYNLLGTSDILLATAKSNVGTNLLAQIWDESKIGGYTPDESPVRNYLLAFVSFRNLKNGGDDEESVGLEDYLEYYSRDKLPDETSDVSAFTSYLNTKANANHVFKGWTNDSTGNSEPFTELPKGLWGYVTLYAVWGLPDSYVTSNIKTSLTSDKTLIEYDSVESITLTAKVTHTAPSSGAMTNPSATYYFVQDGENKTTSENVIKTGVLSVKTVKDSGKYTFKYRLADGLEPLWFYDGECASSEEKTITIEKGKLEHMTIKDFKISSSTVPYYGKELGDVDFTVKMYNKANIEVTQSSARWQIEIDSVTPGTNDDKYIVIVPADTDNYESRYEFLVEFEAQALVIKFNMEQISKEIEVEVEYGQNYGANEIIY